MLSQVRRGRAGNDRRHFFAIRAEPKTALFFERANIDGATFSPGVAGEVNGSHDARSQVGTRIHGG
jgi:hypothetical protein